MNEDIPTENLIYRINEIKR